jgi:hypothetical protein
MTFTTENVRKRFESNIDYLNNYVGKKSTKKTDESVSLYNKTELLALFQVAASLTIAEFIGISR